MLLKFVDEWNQHKMIGNNASSDDGLGGFKL